MEFKKVKLGECVDYILDYRGKTPKKSKTGIPTLSAKSVKNNFIDYDEVYYISRDEYNRFMSKGFPRIGDILMTMEAPLGLVATLDRDDVGLGQRIVTIRGKKDFLDNNYLKFYLQSPKGQHELYSRATGTTVVGISQKNLKNIDIVIPSLENQIRIGRILNNYNIKIEINNKIISNLESQAQAIFKSWFVDFEPFQDGDFVESELGMIPEGWEVKELGELFKFVKGKKPKDLHEKYEDNFIPYIVKGVMDGLETPKFTNEINIVKIKKLDCFMLMDGANSGNIYYGYDGALGSTFALLESKNQVYRELIYWKLKTNESIIKNQNTGSAIPHANKDFINKMNVAIPINIEENEILKTLENFRIKINSLNNQNTKLAELRDALLPKLMAGEIDVSNIKIEGEEVKNE